MSADMGRDNPIAEVQSSSAQARDIGATGSAATGLGNGDGDGIEIEIEGIQQKRIREVNKDNGKSKTEIALNGHYGRAVQTSEVPGDIGWRGANLALRGDSIELPAPSDEEANLFSLKLVCTVQPTVVISCRSWYSKQC